MILTASHMRPAAHALGLNSHASGSFDPDFHRNYYCTGVKCPIWRRLVEAGLAKRTYGPEWIPDGNAYYHLTDTGKEMVIEFMNLTVKDRRDWRKTL